MFTLDTTKLCTIDDYEVGSVTRDSKTYGVASVPADGFRKLVGFCLPNGIWAWVHKNYRKSLRNS